jgi:hypothetical protein
MFYYLIEEVLHKSAHSETRHVPLRPWFVLCVENEKHIPTDGANFSSSLGYSQDNNVVSYTMLGFHSKFKQILHHIFAFAFYEKFSLFPWI